jgi:hypothetical protein
MQALHRPLEMVQQGKAAVLAHRDRAWRGRRFRPGIAGVLPLPAGVEVNVSGEPR